MVLPIDHIQKGGGMDEFSAFVPCPNVWTEELESAFYQQQIKAYYWHTKAKITHRYQNLLHLWQLLLAIIFIGF